MVAQRIQAAQRSTLNSHQSDGEGRLLSRWHKGKCEPSVAGHHILTPCTLFFSHGEAPMLGGAIKRSRNIDGTGEVLWQAQAQAQAQDVSMKQDPLQSTCGNG